MYIVRRFKDYKISRSLDKRLPFFGMFVITVVITKKEAVLQKYVFEKKIPHDDILQIRLPHSVKEDIKRYAKELRVSQAAFLIALVETYKKGVTKDDI